MKQILIVDDAMTVRMYHRKLMEELGFDVEEAENGIEALEKSLCKSFDLMLVDVNMPKMDGYSLVKEMRVTSELRGIPVIMVSTEDKATDMDAAYLSGANLYIVKPANPVELQINASLLVGEAC